MREEIRFRKVDVNESESYRRRAIYGIDRNRRELMERPRSPVIAVRFRDVRTVMMLDKPKMSDPR